MAFRLKPPYPLFPIPVYRVNEEDGVLGRANKNGTITINSNISDPAQEVNTISHEETHVKQIKAGELDYEDNSLTWKGKTYPRKNGKIKYKGKWILEGSKKFPWEQEAYKKEIPL
jgi:hypothetical protein